MSYCINPWCERRQNAEGVESCAACGTSLLINNRFRLIKPLRSLNPEIKDVFEVVDEQGVGHGEKWRVPPGTHRVMKIVEIGITNKEMVRMRREAHALKQLSHPGIPKSYLDDDFVLKIPASSTELYCLVLNKLEGITLDKWLKSHPPITQERAFDWLKQITEILDHVHQNNFFHRDIKPDNIILKPKDRLALIDFEGVREVTHTYLAKVGMAENDTGEAKPTDVSPLMTPGYAPPEQYNAKALPQSDFFALGRTFVYLLTAKSPTVLIDEDTNQLIWRNEAKQIDKPLADFLDELMSVAPAKRPANTRVILQRLENLKQETRRHRFFRSSLFRIGAVATSFLLGFGIYKISSPWIAEISFSRGVVDLQQNKPDDAEKEFQLSTKLNPKLGRSISESYVVQGNQKNASPEIARKFYEQAVKYNPSNVAAYNNLALVCQIQNDVNCVTASYAKLFNLQPKHWEGHFNLGNVYDDREDYKAARKEYEQAVEPDRKLAPQALSNLARLDILEAKYAEAIELIKQGLQRTQNPRMQGGLYKNWGWVLLEQKHTKEARQYLRNARQKDDSRTDTYCLLAQAEEALKDTANAATNWDNCLRMDSTTPEAEQWRSKMLSRLAKLPSP